MNDARVTAIADHLRREMESQHIPGLALGVMVPGEPALLQGFGTADLEHAVPVTPETVFEIASVTKLFTATAVLMLEQAGKLSRQDRVSDYLSPLPPAWKAITIEHILTHSSGIKDYTEADGYWGSTRLDISREQILDLVRDLPLQFPSGQRYSYDNTGFYLLGLLLEEVSGRPFNALLAELIFEPLGMVHTRANNPYAIVPNRAAGYTLEEGQIRHKPYYSSAGTFSAGVLLSTVADMARWDAALDTDALLPQAVLEEMWKPHPSEQKNERGFSFVIGLGWFLVQAGPRYFTGHNGGIVGFASSYLRFPVEQVSVVLFCNQDTVTEPHKMAIFAAEQFIDL